ncbi:helix-turn-helix domain-containing protein [Herbihabitans rhizosphaerae]|uniref:helix-turn-helix domain-containing protein n=1 Tax=Herbihabitans rhizosphaerae TaxID=1872711 RepID=UPI00102C5ECF|nr:helix-turn-helix domain-containing protein [Herbihabitans rhizosphaerae]
MATLTAGQGSRATGVVSGFVLKLARQSAALTQERFAETLRVDVTTVQGWESGRRPLAAMNTGDFLRLCSRLSRLGAPPSTGRHLREAIEADQVLSTGVTAGATWVDADVHPLAASVHRRTITNLITWPITRETPQASQRVHAEIAAPWTGTVASSLVRRGTNTIP